jgi:hypothetical protein
MEHALLCERLIALIFKRIANQDAMLTPVTVPPQELTRSQSAADGAATSKPQASAFADDLAQIMRETDVADDATPIPSQAIPPAPPEKSAKPSSHPTFRPIDPISVASSHKTGEASHDDPTDHSTVEKGNIEKSVSATVSQNGNASTDEMRPADTMAQDKSKQDDTAQDPKDTKVTPTRPPELPLPVMILPTPPLLTKQGEPSLAKPLVTTSGQAPMKIALSRPSSNSQGTSLEGETDNSNGQEASIVQQIDNFALKRSSPMITGQPHTAEVKSKGNQPNEEAKSPQAANGNTPASSDPSPLPLDLQALNNNLMGSDGLGPKKPIVINRVEALASPQGHRSQNPVPVPYGMLPIEIGLGALQGRRTIEVHLSPDDLGTVEIRLEVSDDKKVSANITASRPETLAMMMNDASELRTVLDQTGMTTTADTLQFALKQDGSFTQGNGQNAEQRQNGQPQQHHRSSPPPFQDAVPISSLRRAAGLLDVNI